MTAEIELCINELVWHTDRSFRSVNKLSLLHGLCDLLSSMSCHLRQIYLMLEVGMQKPSTISTAIGAARFTIRLLRALQANGLHTMSKIQDDVSSSTFYRRIYHKDTYRQLLLITSRSIDTQHHHQGHNHSNKSLTTCYAHLCRSNTSS